MQWTRRDLLKTAVSWAGAGLLQPVVGLIKQGKTIASAYPDELLSIEQYSKGRIKPGMIFSSDNAELIKNICPEGLYAELQHGAKIKIAETTLKVDALLPPYWIEATLRNQGQALLDKNGQLWTKNGKPWIGGDPFPNARSGIEAMWNHCFNVTRYDDLHDIGKEFDIDARGVVVREGASFAVRIQEVGRLVVEPKPFIPGYSEELYRSTLTVLKPFDAYGLGATSVVYYDAAKLPDTHLYIPTLRRTRRVLSTQRFEPAAPYAVYFISDLGLHNDPLLTWSWKLIERRPMLAPSPHNKGAFETEKKNAFGLPDTPVKFPRSTWELRPEILVVEGVSFLEGCPYGKKRLYIDAIYNRAQSADIWDRAGNLWKAITLYVADTGITDKMGSTIRDLTGAVFADLQKDFHSVVFFYPKFEDVALKANGGLRVEDWSTPSAMIRRARR
jgi:hypothetical protein